MLTSHRIEVPYRTCITKVPVFVHVPFGPQLVSDGADEGHDDEDDKQDQDLSGDKQNILIIIIHLNVLPTF